MLLRPSAFRRNTEAPNRRRSGAQGFLWVGSGRDEVWRRYWVHTLLVGRPLFRDMVVPRHEALAQLSYTSPQPGESGVRDPKKLSRIVRRASGPDRLYRGQNARVFSPHEINELSDESSVPCSLLGNVSSPAKVPRVLVAILVIYLATILCVHLRGQRQVTRVAHRILSAFGMDGSELVREAQVDVVQESGLVRTVVLRRIECLNDILPADRPVLGPKSL